jgi:broad specificity phosphatase PhoE
MGNVWEEAYERDDCNFLSPLGTRQAEIAGLLLERVDDLDLQVVVSSAMTRARQTLLTMLQQMGDWQRRLTVMPEFNELAWPNGDEKEHHETVGRGVDKLLKLWEGGDALLVCHYNTIQSVVRHLGFDLEDVFEMYDNNHWHIPNATPILYNLQDETIEMVDPYRPPEAYF